MYRKTFTALAAVALAASIFMVTPAALAVTATPGTPIPVGAQPEALAISPDGTLAYVIIGQTVVPIDLASGTTGTPIPVGAADNAFPVDVAFSPNGKLAYVTDINLSTVSVIDVASGTMIAPISILDESYGVAFSPNGKLAYIGSRSGHNISVVDVADGIVGTTIDVGHPVAALAFSPDGTTAYAANFNGHSVSVIDVATGTTGTPIQVGNQPNGVTFSPNGKVAYVANYQDDTVSVIDVATGTVSTIAAGPGPASVAFSPDGTTAYVADSGFNTVSVIDVATGTVGTPITVGWGPVTVAISPDGGTLYTTDRGDGTVSVIHLSATPPAAPFATDAGLTAANQGGLTGSVTGAIATIERPSDPLPDGTEVFVYGYSTPTPIGFYRAANHQIVVNFSTLPAGAHKLLILSPSGTVIGWFGVSVLAATGANVNPLQFGLAGGMVALGLVFFVCTRMRRRRVSL